jgi:hypothetical protein
VPEVLVQLPASRGVAVDPREEDAVIQSAALKASVGVSGDLLYFQWRAVHILHIWPMPPEGSQGVADVGVDVMRLRGPRDDDERGAVLAVATVAER